MKRTITLAALAVLREAAAQNKHIDFYTADLSSKDVISRIRHHGIPQKPEVLVEHFKAFQRIVRITQGMALEVPWILLEMGWTSAMEIAVLSRVEFVSRLTEDGRIEKATAEKIHKRARLRRAELLPHYMNILQNNEPHISQAAI